MRMKIPDLNIWVEKFVVEKSGSNIGVEKFGVEMSCNPIASLGLGMYLTMLVLVLVAKNVYLAVDQLLFLILHKTRTGSLDRSLVSLVQELLVRAVQVHCKCIRPFYGGFTL